MSVIRSVAELNNIKEEYLAKQASYKRRVLVCGGAGCVSSNCQEAQDALVEALEKNGLSESVQVLVTGCMELVHRVLYC